MAPDEHSDRSIFLIEEETQTIKEFKGSRLDLLSKYLIGATWAPIGACFKDTAIEEASMITRLSEILPYTGTVYDLNYEHKCIDLNDAEKTAPQPLAVLKREGSLKEFAPHLRLSRLTFFPLTYVLKDHGFDFEKSFYTTGKQLGYCHKKQIYPIYSTPDNIDIFGNLIDLEGVIHPEKFWETFSKWNQNSIRFSDGNPLIKAVELRYDRDKKYKLVSKYVLSDPQDNFPKDWNELSTQISKHGIDVYYRESFLITFREILELIVELKENPILKDKRENLFTSFMQGYIDQVDPKKAQDATQIRDSVLENPIILDCETGISEALIAYICYFQNPPYLSFPKNLRFVDRGNA